jgi:thiol-disulfide isomerase/thioredoxin
MSCLRVSNEGVYIVSKAVRRKIESAKKTSVDGEIGQKDRAFVLFYATWCPFSQMFLPEFEEYARSNPKECMSVVVDDRPDLCDRYEIEYYPSVLLLKKGKVEKRLDAEPGVGLNKKQLMDFVRIL